MWTKTTGLVLYWFGPYNMNLETPESFAGKSGLFAVTYDSRIVYIGKAGYGNAVFRESKREGKIANMLKEHNVLPKDSDSLEYVNKHCQRYVGIVSAEIQQSDQLNKLLHNAENLLIYEVNKVIPLYNKQSKNKYRGNRPFTVTNTGNKPPGLDAQYSIL